MSPRPKISLAHFTLMDVAPGDLVPLAAEAGFDFVGLRIEPPSPSDAIVPVVGERSLVRKIRQQCDDTGVRIKDIEAFWLRPESDVAALRRAIETGAELGASHLLMVGNDPERSRLVANFAALSDLCRQFGIRPMLEFIPYSQVTSLADALAIRGEVGDEYMGILVDALHLVRSGGTLAEVAAVDAVLLDYLHLCDGPLAAPGPDVADLRAEARGERLYPGEGAFPLADLVRIAPDDAVFAIEAPSNAKATLPAERRAHMAAAAMRSLLDGSRSGDD